MTRINQPQVNARPYSLAPSLLTLLFAVLLAGALIWSTINPYAIFMAYGMMACLIVTIPTLKKGYSLLSPWSALAMTVYIGSGYRTIFVAANPSGGEKPFTSYLMLGKPVDFFSPWSLLYLVGLSLASLGYCLPRKSVVEQKESTFFVWRQFNRGFPVVIAALALIGFGAFYIYAQQTGGLTLANLSGKRAVISAHNNAGSDYQAHGALLLLNSCSSIAFAMTLAKFVYEGKRHSPITLRGVIIIALFVNATLLPFYASLRTPIIYLLMGALVIELSLGPAKKTPAVRPLLAAGVAALILFNVVTTLRDSAVESSSPEKSFIVSTAESLAYNRNLADVVTSSLIMGSVGTTLEYEYGETIAAWMAAPIPRAIWPEKPIISAGPEIGHKVYGNIRSGVPPGFIAEFYWNFGVPGVLVGSLTLGLGLRGIERFRYRHRRNLGVVVLYATVLWTFSAQVFATAVGQALFNVAMSGIFTLVALRFGCSAGIQPKKSAPAAIMQR